MSRVLQDIVCRWFVEVWPATKGGVSSLDEFISLFTPYHVYER